MSGLKIRIMVRGSKYKGSGVFTLISGLIQELSRNNYQYEVFLFTDPT